MPELLLQHCIITVCCSVCSQHQESCLHSHCRMMTVGCPASPVSAGPSPPWPRPQHGHSCSSCRPCGHHQHQPHSRPACLLQHSTAQHGQMQHGILAQFYKLTRTASCCILLAETPHNWQNPLLPPSHMVRIYMHPKTLCSQSLEQLDPAACWMSAACLTPAWPHFVATRCPIKHTLTDGLMPCAGTHLLAAACPPLSAAPHHPAAPPPQGHPLTTTHWRACWLLLLAH